MMLNGSEGVDDIVIQLALGCLSVVIVLSLSEEYQI